MRFKIFKTKNAIHFKELSNIKRSFVSENEELSLFHYFEVEKDLFHVVMHINDEYLLGTKKSGNYMNVPFSQYINCFFLKNSKYFFIEDVGDAYIKDLIAYFTDKTGVTFESFIMTNHQIEKLISQFDAVIKKVEYQDEYEEYFDYENPSHDEFISYNNELQIDYISILCDSNFISIYKESKVSVDNSDQEYIINFVKEVAHGLE